MANFSDISDRILEAVLTKRLLPGARLGEEQLATLFDCSRTIVRESLGRLSARNIVTVTARRGWYLVELSRDEAREAFEARHVIETGLLRVSKSLSRPALDTLRAHVDRQQSAVNGSDIGLRSFVLGDFHVCLAECLGNKILADMLRDLTARTTLIAVRHQSGHNAAQSCAEHIKIVEALEAGNMADAEQLMSTHLNSWQAKLPMPQEDDPLAQLRMALQPQGKQADMAQALHTTEASKSGKNRRPLKPIFSTVSGELS